MDKKKIIEIIKCFGIAVAFIFNCSAFFGAVFIGVDSENIIIKALSYIYIFTILTIFVTMGVYEMRNNES